MPKTPVPGEAVPSEAVPSETIIVDPKLTPDDSQVRDRVPPASRRPRAAGKATEQLIAVIDKDARLSARPRMDAKPEVVVDPDYAFKLARELREAHPDFTAEKLRSRANGAVTIQAPVLAPRVIRKRRTRWIVLFCAIGVLIGTVVITRFVTGAWPWHLLWQLI